MKHLASVFLVVSAIVLGFGAAGLVEWAAALRRGSEVGFYTWQPTALWIGALLVSAAHMWKVRRLGSGIFKLLRTDARIFNLVGGALILVFSLFWDSFFGQYPGFEAWGTAIARLGWIAIAFVALDYILLLRSKQERVAH